MLMAQTRSSSIAPESVRAFSTPGAFIDRVQLSTLIAHAVMREHRQLCEPCLATATVASHMQRMSSKLGVRTRTELLSFFGPTEPVSIKRASSAPNSPVKM
jgi:hypothetical protein